MSVCLWSSDVPHFRAPTCSEQLLEATAWHTEDHMDRTEIALLPPLVDVTTAAQVLGISRTLAYQLVKADRWPTTVLRVGKLIRIPTAALLRIVDDEVRTQP